MNWRKFKAAVFALLFSLSLILLPFFQSFAGSDSEASRKSFLIIDADKQFDFAENYFANKEYSRAVNEHKRFVYFFPEDERVELAMYRIGTSYYLGKRFNDAVDAFMDVIDRYTDTDFSIKSYFMVSESHMKLNALGSAIINLHNLIAITDDADVKDEANYRIGWIHLEMASWEEAKRYFSKISTQNQNKYRIEKLYAELEKERSIPKKNPQLAGFASIVPGAGYLYCERYQDAFITFLLNGALMYAAYESFDEGHDALGGIISFVGFGFYTANFYGAVSSAHKYNRRKTGQFIKELKDAAKVNLFVDFKNKGACFALQFAF